jgi:hypothetical protein
MKKLKKGCVTCKNYNTQVITAKCLFCNNGSNFKAIPEFKSRSEYRRFVLGK